MNGENEFNIEINPPKDISDLFYNKFYEFLDEDMEQIKSYFSELLLFKRSVFSLEIAAPIKVIHEIEKFLNDNRYLTYNQFDFVTKGDENIDFFPQDLFDKYPNEIMGATVLYISLRNEFIHLAELVENIPLSCDLHKGCDPRAALKGLLLGYQIKNIIGFIEQNR